MREIKHLSIHQWIRFAIPDSQQPTSPIGFLFLKLPPPPCAVLLVMIFIDNHREDSIVGVEATMSHQLRSENCVEGQLEMDKPVEK